MRARASARDQRALIAMRAWVSAWDQPALTLGLSTTAVRRRRRRPAVGRELCRVPARPR
jgi:hypothetical protein